MLICDDADAVRRLLRLIIELDPDLRVVGEARDGREAIIESTRLEPDVVLLDLSMPGLSGLEALPMIKASAPAARVIVFTGLSGSFIEKEVIDAGADRFLQKGALPTAITSAVKEVYATAREPVDSDFAGAVD